MRRKGKRQPVVINFLDHVDSTADKAGVSHCEAYGVLLKEDDIAYYIMPWISDGETKSHNSNVYTIIKHPGISLTYLVPAKSQPGKARR